MEFIKQMKKREFIEMGLKALASLFAVFLAIILMEGMIYGIALNHLSTNPGNPSKSTSHTTAYCIEHDDDNYLVLYHLKDKYNDSWFSEIKVKDDYTAEELEVAKVIYDEPNAFELSIEGFHFAIMAVLVVAVAGYFTYRFIRLNQAYKKIEAQYLKDGTIEITNV